MQMNKNIESEKKNPETMLAPYRILDLTDEKGTYCGTLLGNLGAEVIKLEKPGGDPARRIGPFYKDIPHHEKSLSWLAYNNNKKSITLDIEDSEGKQIFKKLVNSTDAIIESFDPGYLDKLSLGYDDLQQINSKIILTSITPFGQTGPYVERGYKASDLTCWAWSSMLFSSGSFGRGPVHISHVSHSFMLGSADAAWSTVMAIFGRGISGEGQYIDVSIIESVQVAAHFQYVDWKVRGIPYEKHEDQFTVPPIRPGSRWVWEIKDGYMSFHVTGGQWGQYQVRPVVEWMNEEGLADEYLLSIDWGNLVFEELPKSEAERIRNYFVNFFKTKTKNEVISEALKRGIPLDVLNNPGDVLKHPQLKNRDYWQYVEEPELKMSLPYPSFFCKSSENTSKIWRHSPYVGEHNEDIYIKELGLNKEQLAALRQSGII